MPTVTGRSLKVTAVLDAGSLLDITVPDGQPRIVLNVRLADRSVAADLAAKGVRKAIAAIREYGPDASVAIIQGKLAAGDRVLEAGLVVQQRTPKVVAVAA